MGIDKLILIASTLAMLTVSTGQVPKVLRSIQMAQIQLLKESQSSKWGQGMLLPVTK